MATVQDGGVVGDTKKTLGLGTADPPLILEVPPQLLIVREAEPPEVWNSEVWRHGIGSQIIGGTAAERQTIALINPAGSGAALRLHRIVITDRTASDSNWEIREGPIGLFVSPSSTDWADFDRRGDPAATVDALTQVGVVAGSQIREERRTSAEVHEAISETPFVVHPSGSVMVNAGVDNVAFAVSFWFEQFRSSSQF